MINRPLENHFRYLHGSCHSGGSVFSKQIGSPVQQPARRHFFERFALRKRLKKNLLFRVIQSERLGLYGVRLVFEARFPKFLARF